MSCTLISKHQFEKVSFPEYKVTYERLTDQFTNSFTPGELKEYLSLYERAQKDPKKTKEQVEEWLERFNHLPEIYNLLGYIYVRLKKIKKAEKLIEENYKHNPDNLFAKVNYADQCLRKGKLDEIPHIFQNKENLQELFPNRSIFHYSELIGFYTLLGFYYLKLGDREKAKDYCTFVKMIDPEDAAIRHLTKKLSQKGLLSHFLDRFKRTPKKDTHEKTKKIKK